MNHAYLHTKSLCSNEQNMKFLFRPKIVENSLRIIDLCRTPETDSAKPWGSGILLLFIYWGRGWWTRGRHRKFFPHLNLLCTIESNVCICVCVCVGGGGGQWGTYGVNECPPIVRSLPWGSIEPRLRTTAI